MLILFFIFYISLLYNSDNSAILYKAFLIQCKNTAVNTLLQRVGTIKEQLFAILSKFDLYNETASDFTKSACT